MRTRYLRALIVVLFVAGITSATFFVSNRLSSSQNVAPNAPDSKPFALTSTIRNGVRLPDEDIRDIQRTTATTTKSNVPLVDRSDERDYVPRPASTPAPTQNPASPTSAPDNQANYQTPTSSQNYPPNRPPTTPPATNSQAPNIPVPTPTFVQGTFGSYATAQQRANNNSYMSDANNNCTDKQGFISGTGCREDGTRFVLGLPDTQRAYQQALNKAQNEITNKTDAELIQISGITCKETDQTCKNDAIKIATDQLLKANAVVLEQDKDKISDTRTVNQATQDIVFLNDKEYELKYGSKNRETGFEKLLVKLGVTKESLGIEVDSSKLVASRDIIAKYSDPNTTLGTLRSEYCKTTNDPTCLQDFKREDILNNLQLPTDYKNTLITAFKEDATKGQKITEQTLEYLSNKSDQELAKDFCAKSGNRVACEKSFDREDLIAYNPNPQEIIQMKKDQSLVQLYADPRNSVSDLAKIYCKGNRSCEETFTTDRFLSQISNPLSKQDAINNRISALSTLIPQVVSGKPVTGIDVETKKEIVKLNEDTTYAFWVYVRDPLNAARQRKDNISTEQLALEFNEIVKNNPSALTENLKKYNENPKLYNMTFTTFKFDKEENPLIIAQYNQIIKTQPIKGLFEDNKIVTWTKASEEFKQQARLDACEKVEAIKASCFKADFGSGKEGSVGYKNAVAEIDKYLTQANNYQAIFQDIYQSRTTDNLLSTNQSNLATVDNPALGNPTLQAEIKKAKNAAEVEDIRNQMAYSTQTYGDGMGMTPMIIPNTYNGTNTKLTEEEKTAIANEYIRRQVVVETYTRGAGVTGALTTAGIATAACSAFGPPGIAISIGCGAVAGLAGVISNIVPILGTATAEEIEAERQFWVKKTGNDQVGTFVQAMFTNQGAASDESWFGGRSQSTLNNQYALLDRIHEANYLSGATTNTLTNLDYQAQLAIQPYLLQQGELLQQENREQQKLNIASSLIVGGISGGVGGSLANKAISETASTLTNFFKSTGDDMLLWAGGAAINDVQTQYQFDQTVGYIDTQSEIDLEKCNRAYGSGSETCKEKLELVIAENDAAKDTARQQAIITDAIIQSGQTTTSFVSALYSHVRSSQNAGGNPNTPTPTTQANLATAINNLISSSATSENTIPVSNTNTPPSSVLSTDIKNVLNEITTNEIVIRNNPERTVNDVNRNQTINDTDKRILITVLQENKVSSQDFFKKPTTENFKRLIEDINSSADKLKQQFGGDVDAAKAGIIEILQIIETRENLSGRTPIEVENLVNATKVQTGIYKPTNPSTPEYTAATPIDPFTEATERLIDLRARRSEDLSIEEVKILIEGLEVTDEMAPRIATTMHELQKNADFQDAVKQVSSALAQADAAKKAISNTDIASLFELTSERIVFDKTAELAKKLSPSNTTQQTAAVPPPNTPPPPVPPARPNTNTNDDQATLITPTRPKLTRDQKNRLVEMYIKEIDSLNTKTSSSLPTKGDFMDAYNDLMNKYREYGLDFDRTNRTSLSQPRIPEGYSIANIALIRLKNTFNDPGTPPRLTPTQRAELNNLASAVTASTTDNQRAIFQRVLDERVDALLNGEADTNLLGTTNNSNTPPLTYENTINLPRDAFTESQLNGINNLIGIVNNSTSPKLKESATQALNQLINEYENNAQFIIPVNDTANNPSNTNILQKAISSVVNFIRNIPEGRKAPEQGGISFRLGSAGNVDGDWEKVFGGLIWIKREKTPIANNSSSALTPSSEISTNRQNGFVIYNSNGDVLNDGLGWSPSDSKPFIFTKEEASIIFEITDNWDVKPATVKAGTTDPKTQWIIVSQNEEPTIPSKLDVSIKEKEVILNGLITENEINNKTTTILRQSLGESVAQKHVIYNSKGDVLDKNLSWVNPNTNHPRFFTADQASVIFELSSNWDIRPSEARIGKFDNVTQKVEILSTDSIVPQSLNKAPSAIKPILDSIVGANFTDASRSLYNKLQEINYTNSGVDERQLQAIRQKTNNRTTDEAGLKKAEDVRIDNYISVMGEEASKAKIENTRKQMTEKGLKLVFDKLSKVAISYTGDKQNVTFDLFKLTIDRYGYTGTDIELVKQFFELNGGRATHRELLTFVAKMEIARIDGTSDITPSTADIQTTSDKPVIAIKIDHTGKLIVKDDRLPGITLALNAESPESIAARAISPQGLAGKSLLELNPQSEYQLGDIPNLPRSLSDQIISKYSSEEILDLYKKLTDTTFRVETKLDRTRPVLDILEKAQNYNIPTQGRYLSSIALDIRSVENQITTNGKYQPPVTFSERAFSSKSIIPRLAEAIIEVYRISPDAIINDIEFNNYRYWSLDYFDENPNWLEFTQNIKSNRKIPNLQKEIIIKNAREYLTDRINASLKSNNPDINTVPKGQGVTILDLHQDRENSIALMKKFLSNDLITDTQNAITELNNLLTIGGDINGINIDKKWGIKNLDLKDFKAGDIVTLSISQDPKLPVIAHFADNGIYFTYQGDNNEVLTAVFGTKLKSLLPPLDPNFPVIEQTNINDPSGKTTRIKEGGIPITGKKLDPDFISDSPVTPNYEEITKGNEVAHISKFHNDNGTSVEGLFASLTKEERANLMSGKIVNHYFENTTEATINNTHVATDLVGFSAISDTVTKVASTMTDRVQAKRLFDGSADMEDIYQRKIRSVVKDEADFIPYESAGDGLRGFSPKQPTAESLSRLVDASSIYQDLLVEALAGKHGINAQEVAKVIVHELGDDSIYFKIGISGDGRTKATFLPGKNGYSVEIKPSSNTDIYLDNVKKYINLIKKQGGKPPKNIIGISKDVYKTLVDTNQINSLNTLGKKVITVNIPEFGKAYFITNTDYTSPIKNNAIKTNIVKFIDFIKGNIFSNGQSQVNTSQPNLAASTINTESSHIQESAVNKQKTISPDEKVAILKMWGVDQTEAELILNPSPENISKIKKYFLEPNNGTTPLTPKELVIDLIDSGLISIVHHDTELYYHLDKYFVETTGYTYSSLANTEPSHKVTDGPVIIKKLNEVFGYTNEEILTNLRLIGLIKKEDPQVFFTVFGIDNKYQSYISKFGQSDTEDLLWASLVTNQFTGVNGSSITRTLVDLGMPVDRITNLLDSFPSNIYTSTTSPINLNDIVTLKQWGVSDETILETVLKNSGRIFAPGELSLAGLSPDTILKYSDIKWFTPTANRLDKLKQPFRKAKVAIDKTLISQRLKLDVARSGEVSRQKLKSFKQAVQDFFTKLTGKQQIANTPNPDYIENAPIVRNNELRSQRRTEIIGRISGTSIATSTLTLLAHMFGIIELPFDNNVGAVDLSTGAYLINSQPTPIITPSPTLTPTPTISPTTTTTPAFNIQNEYKIEDNDITRSQLNVYQAINECQNALDDASFTPENMSKCFCQAMEDNCQGATTKEISTRIQEYYSSKNMILTNESTTYLFEPIFDSKIINPETGKLEPSYCQNSKSQICSTTNDPKFTLCDPSTAEKLFPSDMIVDQNDNVYNCQFGSNYDSATGNITCIIVSATGDKNKLSNTSSVPFNMADAKKIIRSSQYKDNDVDKCWD